MSYLLAVTLEIHPKPKNASQNGGPAFGLNRSINIYIYVNNKMDTAKGAGEFYRATAGFDERFGEGIPFCTCLLFV